jgi:hypothetical protein
VLRGGLGAGDDLRGFLAGEFDHAPQPVLEVRHVHRGVRHLVDASPQAGVLDSQLFDLGSQVLRERRVGIPVRDEESHFRLDTPHVLADRTSPVPAEHHVEGRVQRYQLPAVAHRASLPTVHKGQNRQDKCHCQLYRNSGGE